ncbi:amino acid adenylation domain-containing protein [Hyunsoonleella flava]|uniref:Amino acid adenylation domain-containing protein n=1 Tax=Hyunsoonleella flava TaxID=2527939 RepID=A0A4Q9FE05_9FLAO|nr:amino acid adenylation domain-containing protein [Hyunsoonleella flava]TBN04422.1 amino acid adenylation domain-containing protein [Hyunsoonleella flava]
MQLFTLPDIVKNSAKLYPNREAFKNSTNTVTFFQLDTKTSQLAKYLIDSGVKKGDRVGIYLNRCLETVIAIYGILKAGAVYVPLDFTAPHTRTKLVLENCEITFLISSPTLKSKVTKLLGHNLSLKCIIGLTHDVPVKTISWEDIFKIDLTEYQPIKILENDLAYIMFTSGSTGEPKGIMHTHKSGLSYAKLSSDLYGLNHEDRVGNHAPINFDISTFGYFSAPLVGASTVLVSDAHTKLPSSLAQLIGNENITIWYSVPLALIQLLNSGMLDKLNMASLRWVLFGGEVFGLKYLKELMKKWPNAKFSNVYGPAEVNQCTYYNFQSLPPNIKSLPLGKVWRNTDFKILNTDDEEAKLGKKGELVIRSGTMMSGYWKNKELTEKSLYRETLDTSIEYVYYRTGDIVYQDENGVLFFVGRDDRQVKIRGYRIDLDEIESVLINHPDVNEAAVMVLNVGNEKEIYAAILLFEDRVITPKELKLFCKKHLAIYAIPDDFEILKDLPRTSSGKIDKKRIIAIKKN